MEGDGCSRWGVGGRGLAEGAVRDGAGTCEDAEPCALAAAEPGDSLHDVGPSGDLEDVRAHDGLGLPRNDDGRLRLVLGAGGPAPWSPDDLDGGLVAGFCFGPGHGLFGSRGRRGSVSGGGVVLGGLAVGGAEGEVMGEGMELGVTERVGVVDFGEHGAAVGFALRLQIALLHASSLASDSRNQINEGTGTVTVYIKNLQRNN